MGMDLILWKAPVIDDPDEAERLLKPYYEHGDDSAFEPSPDVTAVEEELFRRFPDAIEWSMTNSALDRVDRVLILSMSWSVDNAVLDAIEELARKHELVLYDPQGPNVNLPTDPIDPGPQPEPTFVDHLKLALIGVVGAGMLWLGLRIDVLILDWVLMIVGGFVLSVVVFLVYGLYFGPKEDEPDQPRTT